MRMASEMKNTSNWDYTHCMTVVSLEMSDEPKKLKRLDVLRNILTQVSDLAKTPWRGNST